LAHQTRSVGVRAINLIEAIKSGRPFKRSSYSEWKCVHHQLGNLVYLDGGQIYPISAQDILATDWETKEVEVTVTRTAFLNAWAEALKEEGMTYYGPAGARPINGADIMSVGAAQKLIKRLGLGDPA
jgi:hypothetical protein